MLALMVAACAPARVADTPGSRNTTLLPPDLAIGFLQGIKSRTSPVAFGSETVPPCRFTDKGAWSGGEYRKLTGARAPSKVTGYDDWILVKINDPGGRDMAPADADLANAWNYWLRSPRTARTMFGTTDHCLIGPTTEPAKKVVEALVALGVTLVPEYGHLVR